MAMRRATLALALAGSCLPAWAQAPAAVVTPPSAVRIVDDGVPLPLTTAPASAERGRALVGNRQQSMCLLCHQVPIAEAKFQGDISTDLAGVGARWTAAQLRLRLVDARAVNPSSPMPSYYRPGPLTRVAPAWRDKPLLDAQQIEDVIAWLQTQR